MTSLKPVRPPFQAIELDSIDARLEAKAAEKGIPTLVTPKSEPLPEVKAPPAVIESPAPKNRPRRRRTKPRRARA